MNNGRIKRWCTQSHVRVICEPKAFLGDTDEVPIQLVILVLIVYRDDSIVAGR